MTVMESVVTGESLNLKGMILPVKLGGLLAGLSFTACWIGLFLDNDDFGSFDLMPNKEKVKLM